MWQCVFFLSDLILVVFFGLRFCWIPPWKAVETTTDVPLASGESRRIPQELVPALPYFNASGRSACKNHMAGVHSQREKLPSIFFFFGNNHQPSNHPLGGYLGIWMDMRVSIVMGVPQKLDCLFHGKSQSKMDDLEVPPFQESPIWDNMSHKNKIHTWRLQ